MPEDLKGPELAELVRRVFAPRPGEKALAVLVDLPDARTPDNPDWQLRRDMAASWVRELAGQSRQLGLEAHLVLYRNAGANNGDLPPSAWLHAGGPLPRTTEELDPARSVPWAELFASHPILLAPTELSATAPLKLAAKIYPIRAATMPGFKAAMIPALRLDYAEVNRRVGILKGLLDRAAGADLRFRHPGGESLLHLDLRFRQGHASGGLLPSPGMAGNLPSGEAYIVPYEGEGEPSRSAGELPVQFGSEVVRYRVAGNRAAEVLSRGPESDREAALLEAEPAYANLAELGLGVLDAFGVKPVGEVLLDEKLGLHIAFGRSDHFGGRVGPTQFSSPAAVVHIDRVYVPQTQPDIRVAGVELVMEDGRRSPLMRDGSYLPEVFS
ncbi:MAG: hypothetical protein HY926_06845 [Elusimicrobia bacterium]|nr:hypothetical protein [Elusimicrobiota bacterium]